MWRPLSTCLCCVCRQSCGPGGGGRLPPGLCLWLSEVCSSEALTAPLRPIRAAFLPLSACSGCLKVAIAIVSGPHRADLWVSLPQKLLLLVLLGPTESRAAGDKETEPLWGDPCGWQCPHTSSREEGRGFREGGAPTLPSSPCFSLLPLVGSRGALFLAPGCQGEKWLGSWSVGTG